MKPLILQFVEKPTLEKLDMSMVEYSNEQNLTVLKDSTIPAIDYVSMDTETFTKVQGEVSDSDNSLKYHLNRLIDTSTETLNSTEPSDSDNNYSIMKMLMDTQTITESIENTDSDK